MDEEKKEKPETPEPDTQEPELEQESQAEDTLQEPEPQESAPKKPNKQSASGSRLHRFKSWYKKHKKISIPATVVLLILVLAAIPASRYGAAGLVVKKDLGFQVLDSSSNTPVSDASVSAGSVSGTTDGNGYVTLKGVRAGQHSVLVSKKYYQDKTINVLVPILKSQQTLNVDFVATGRQVKIITTNLINGNKLGGVEILVADVEAKTDDEGSATVVVPTGAASQKATLNLTGYNEASVDIKVSPSGVEENKVKLTPAGKIYFLSKRTGSLDVMKVNLDGTNPEIVVKGTGYEQQSDTVLMPSLDGRHVALVAKRTKSEPSSQLYVFSTQDEKPLQADSGDAQFSLIGWSGSHLVYSIVRNDLEDHQLGKNKLKSYDASTGKITLIDQTEASDPFLFAAHRYDLLVLAADTVVFAKAWSSNFDLDNKPHSLHTANANGQNYKTVSKYDSDNFVQYSRYSPVGFHIWQNPESGGDGFYDYVVGSQPKQISLDGSQFYEDQHLYYFSPSAKKTMWTERRDGKNTILVADGAGAGQKSVASLAEHFPEGWYTDEYLLLSKDDSELFIMSAAGGEPVKVTDYQSSYNYY